MAKTKTDQPAKQADTEAKEILKALEIPLDSDQVVKIGDWEGPAKEFRKHWISQADLQKMREKDKTENARQLESERTRIELEHQRRMQEFLMQQRQPQRQGGGIDATLNAIYDKLRQDQARQGFVDVDSLNEILGVLRNAFVQELSARDQIIGRLGQGLDQWYGDYQNRTKILDSLSTTHTDKQWSDFIDALAKDNPELPRSTIELMASAYEAAEDETPEQLQEGIRDAIAQQRTALDTHRAETLKRQHDEQEAIVGSGIPGVGGSARPSRTESRGRATVEEVAERFGHFDEQPG